MSSHARIRVEIEISNGSAYGPDWTLAAIRKQVKEEAMQKLRNLIEPKGGRIVGEPEVVTIIDTEEK